jgi:hypothetical protein
VSIQINSTWCYPCGLKNRKKNYKIVWPETEALQQMVAKFGYKETGKQLGVSDNAVRKRLK